jgi:hypothetical protein
MFKHFAGVYRRGRVELDEIPPELEDGTRVLVIVLEHGLVDLRAHGIDEAQAAKLREALSAFADDWNSPEMVAYDYYEAAYRAKPIESGRKP